MIDICAQLSRLATESTRWEDRYKIEQPPFIGKETVFLPIRHFNSDHPITPGLIKTIPYNIAEQPLYRNYGGSISMQPALIGGGFYLWHKGTGIAIDPGYGFVDSLHRYHNINVQNIHIVVITHDHLDHHADLETIINLRRGAEDDLKIFSNEEIDDVYQLSERELIPSYGIKYYPISIKGENKIDLIEDKISAIILPTLHWQRTRKIRKKKDDQSSEMEFLTPDILLSSHFNAVGIQISLDDIDKKILITGDTLFPVFDGESWFAYQKINAETPCKSPYLKSVKSHQLGWTPSTLNKYRDFLVKMIEEKCNQMIGAYRHLEKSDIVCLHIGSLEKGFTNLPENIKGTTELFNARNNVDLCYPGFHLGLLGCVRLMEILINSNKENSSMGFDSDNGIIILTEFGEELLGNRQNICMALADILKEIWPEKKHCSILPSEITLRLRLHHQDKDEPIGMFCSYCGKIHDWHFACAEEGPGEIITYFSKGPGIDRVNRNCICW